jgi:hypothetical protein
MLWDEARSHHVTTVAIFWSVTAGATIDWGVLEIWESGKGKEIDLAYIAKFSTPSLLERAMAVLGPPQPGTGAETSRTHLAAFR